MERFFRKIEEISRQKGGYRGQREEYVKRILDVCGLHPQIGIPVLKERSLIAIKNQEIHMHDMLQELGKKLVREKYPEEPALWSRVWLCGDFESALMSVEKGTNNVKAMVLDQKKYMPESRQLRIEGLSRFKDLKLLILYHKNFLGSLDFLSSNLQYLGWHGYPFPSLHTPTSNRNLFKWPQLSRLLFIMQFGEQKTKIRELTLYFTKFTLYICLIEKSVILDKVNPDLT
ncbi:hypothetical protein PIB30_058775 [Stylosanthes scabra]|uniref:Disease resistance protein Roq1-like winged-helix domain-containing protein n=1 Tax=Stylosanthes scabra TaxID=79078 RepID=A0ABU6UKV6_9FABA|nr:hypothetical protein [Stylosanthes scabra]